MKPKSPGLRAGRSVQAAGAMGAWLAKRSGRERVLILCMGVLAGISVVWYGIASPLLELRSAAHARLEAADEFSARHEARSAATGTAQLTALQGPISDVMGTRAAAFGLSLTQVETDGSDNAASVVVVSDRYDAVMPFVAVLERVDGVQIQSLSLASAGKPGLVRLQISARRP